MRLAPASDFSADVVWSGSGDEIVVLASLELQASRWGRESPEGDGEESFGVFPITVTQRHLGGLGVAHPAALVVFFIHIVDYVPEAKTKEMNRRWKWK